MTRSIPALLLLLIFTFHLSAQNEEILLTVNGHKVSKEEFIYNYNKNNNLYQDNEKSSPKEYLDLFIDFKLKVAEAIALRMDTSQSFKNELAGYRKEVAAPYLTDIEFNEQQVRELYRRTTLEVNASHILLKLDNNATPRQQKDVLNKISSIREEIANGKDFSEAAVEYSEDPSVVRNKGTLGYFSAFMMVAPFEDAAFSTPAHEISEPVRSSFGYHLIRVNDVRKNQGEIQVAHIMKNARKDASPEVLRKAKEEIDLIYEQLMAGADFETLAKKQSDDRKSATKGGEMPWFAAGRIVPEFSNAAFALENNGDVSQPVQTDFGFHIIKKLDARPVPSFEASRKKIEAQIKRDPERRTSSKKAFIDQLKAEYNFSEYTEEKETLARVSPKELDELPQTKLFVIDNNVYTSKHFAKYLHQGNRIGSVLNSYNNWVDYEITLLEDSKLEDKYPEFRYLMNEYYDGILLFTISQEKIWNLASKDTTGLTLFYEKNKNLHKWGSRFKGSIITCSSVAIREEVDKLLGAGLNLEELKLHINTDSTLISYESGAWEQGENEVVDFYVWNGPESDNFDSVTTFIRGDLLEDEPKLLQEARGLYISDYQNYLEENWLKELHRKYKVKIDKQVLKTISGD